MLGRFAIFVDAGYLFAAGGALCCGTIDRRRLALDGGGATRALMEMCAQRSGLEHLRTYWYDGAEDAQPTAQHLDIAYLPGVKLRLGRLSQGRQKGVDSRIVRDLIVLSEQRAMSVAYLVGGDEDLREGVVEAQERGVRVVLVGVEPPTTQNLSPTLRMDADDVVVLDRPFVERFMSLRESSTFTGPEVGFFVEAGLRALGREFGIRILREVPPERIAEIRRGRPRIPSELDSNLLREAFMAVGGRKLEDEERSETRQGFWEALLADPRSSSPE